MGKNYEVKPYYKSPKEETLDFSTVEHLLFQFSPLLDPHDVVSESDIRHWCEVMHDANPLYYDTEYAKNSEYGSMIAPPAMVQAFTLFSMEVALKQFRKEEIENPEYPHNELNERLMQAGYTGIMATAQQQTFHAPIKLGDQVFWKLGIGMISDHDHFTRQGVGRYFVMVYEFYNQNEEKVCTMNFRLLRYKPPMETRRMYKG